MKPVHKPLTYEGNLPFSFVYRRPKERKEEWPNHLHEWWELIYIHTGEATFFIDQHIIYLKKGDLIFVPPNIIHRTMIKVNQVLTTSVLYLFPTHFIDNNINRNLLFDLFRRSERKQKFRYFIPIEKQDTVEKYLNLINLEKKNENPFWEEAAFTHIIQLMIQLHRWEDVFDSGVDESPTNPPWLNIVIEYIDEHLHETVRLKDLSDQIYMSSVYFSKKFKQTVGMTVSDFLIKKRTLKAKELLRESDANVQEVAELSGYHSIPYFHRTFKKLVGKTPTEYRKDNLKT
ncbi:helix-turn-helix transcriptional regulator [Salinicoccus albus]|uniref:helix-turn-helix transcriptional regulator n=1 Tax=Salinicoccus albus TaxID=418756 RepID=UPI00035DF98A|nr:AraC family transcriptional regulator [Salinicoccus albus]